MWRLGVFAGVAIAGNVFLIAEPIAIGCVDLIEFTTDFLKEGFLDFAGEADADFVTVAGFDNFGTGVVRF
jgi:hypothetical protein